MVRAVALPHSNSYVFGVIAVILSTITFMMITDKNVNLN